MSYDRLFNSSLNSIPDKEVSSRNRKHLECSRERSRSSRSFDSGRSSVYSMRELICNVRDAVVSISGQLILANKNGVPTIKTYTGNGFFIKGHYIICPSGLVLTSPILLGDEKRIPPITSVSTLNSSIRVSRIIVDVSNVNGSGFSYSYEANLIGVDGVANIAVLRINMELEWNKFNPELRSCHPCLQWGKSRSSCPGDTVILIGNTTASINNIIHPGAENAVSIGNISDNRYVFPNGQVQGELLLLSNILTRGCQTGIPVIKTDGTVIGMSIFINDYHHNYNVALAEFFMRRPVKALIRSYQDNNVPDNYKGFVELVIDPIENYYRFNKSCLGISGIIMGQNDFNTLIEPKELEFVRKPILKVKHKTLKEIVGYRILALNHPSQLVSPSPKNNPLYNNIVCGDIITHLNDCPLGDRKGQISPSLIMWRVLPGDKVKIRYLKQSENFNVIHEVEVETFPYQVFLDFPFYSSDSPVLKDILPILI